MTRIGFTTHDMNQFSGQAKPSTWLSNPHVNPHDGYMTVAIPVVFLMWIKGQDSEDLRNHRFTESIGTQTIPGWWFGTCFIFPYIGNNHPNWHSYFSVGLKPPTRSSSTALGLRSSCQGLCCLGDRDSAAAERAGELVEWYPAKSGTHRISVVVSMSCWKICLFSGNPPGNLLKTDCFCCSPHKHMQDNVARPRGNFDSYSEPPFFAAWLTI